MILKYVILFDSCSKNFINDDIHSFFNLNNWEVSNMNEKKRNFYIKAVVIVISGIFLVTSNASGIVNNMQILNKEINKDDVNIKQTGIGDVSLSLNSGDNVAYLARSNTLEISIANDEILEAMVMSYKISSPVTQFIWDMEYGNIPPVNEHGRAIGRWDLTQGLNPETDFDSISPEYFKIWGAAFWIEYGLPSGPHELCYTIKFNIPFETPETENGICIELYNWPQAYPDWMFNDEYSSSYAPTFCGQVVEDQNNPVVEPVCFDIVAPEPISGDVNYDGQVDIDDVVYFISYIFSYGPSPYPETCYGDVNADGQADIDDVVYLIAYIYSGGPAPDPLCCD